MDVSAHIDWLATTNKGGGASVHQFLLDEPYEDIKPRNGYTVARRFVQGVVEMGNPERPEMGKHVIYSAQALRMMELEHGFLAFDTLRWHVGKGHHIARLDLAIDVRDSGLKIRKLSKLCRRGKCETRTTKFQLIDGLGNDGDTLYIGSMKSRKKLVRIYDKAKERKEDGDWKRIEIEFRGLLATKAAQAVVSNGDLGKTAIAMVKAFADFPSYRIWNLIMQADEIPITVSNERSSNTERWLLKQCAPALARASLANPDFMAVFVNAVGIKIERMKSGALHD